MSGLSDILKGSDNQHLDSGRCFCALSFIGLNLLTVVWVCLGKPPTITEYAGATSLIAGAFGIYIYCKKPFMPGEIT